MNDILLFKNCHFLWMVRAKKLFATTVKIYKNALQFSKYNRTKSLEIIILMTELDASHGNTNVNFTEKFR